MSEQDPVPEGRAAYFDGLPLSQCPHPMDSDEAVEWKGGWRKAEAAIGDE
jgi:hypothetical protein